MLKITFVINWLSIFFLTYDGSFVESMCLTDTRCSPPIPPSDSILKCEKRIDELQCYIKCERAMGKMTCNFKTGNWDIDNSTFVCIGGSSLDGAMVNGNQDRDQNDCEQLTAILHGKVLCYKYPEKMKCYIRCSPNYAFPDGDESMNIRCVNGKWEPVDRIPECVLKSSNSSTMKTLRDRCQRPKISIPSEIQCIQKHGSNQCTVRCLSNHKFSDGRLALTATCLFSDGVWIPFQTFPNCIERTFEQTWGCYQPQAIAHGETSCHYEDNIVFCFAKCKNGFVFPRNIRRSRIRCDRKRGIWLPPEGSLTCINTGESHIEERCCLPSIIVSGSVFCFSTSLHSVICKARCKEGYQFADGKLLETLVCDDKKGKLVPFEEFPPCIPRDRLLIDL